jgi:tetratricopeptide (TPR) repeat protein
MSPSWSRLSALVVLVGMLCTSLPLTAQDLPPEKLEAFKKHVQEATKQYKEGDYASALEEFRRARKLLDLPEISYRIGRTLEQVGHCSKAESTYQGLLEHSETKEKQRKKAEQRLESIDEQCEPRGKLVVRCTPEEAAATVRVAGESKPCPATFELEPGEHTIEVTASTYPDQADTTTVSEAETTRGTFNLSTPSPDPTDSESSTPPAWRPIVKWGSFGAGAGFLAVGLIDDIASANRFDRRIDEASSENDVTEYEQALVAYEGARPRVNALYVTGAIFTVAGATFAVLDATESSQKTKGVSISFGASPTSVHSRIRW